VRIELRDVRKQLGGVWALDGVSLDVPSGARVALVGPNGSGKSTLVRAVMGLVRCDGVRIDGLDPRVDGASLAARIAYVPQAAPRLGASVGEVVRAVATLRSIPPGAIRWAARALALNLDEVSSRPMRALSGGMQQKLMIALALAAPVSLLVLDEPTASLDARARESFFRLFNEQASRPTLLLSSHRVDEVDRLADRVIGLENGRVAFDVPTGSEEVADRLTGRSLRGRAPIPRGLREVCA
jgi:ABC-type multidrug transport system ATPase subunit